MLSRHQHRQPFHPSLLYSCSALGVCNGTCFNFECFISFTLHFQSCGSQNSIVYSELSPFLYLPPTLLAECLLYYLLSLFFYLVCCLVSGIKYQLYIAHFGCFFGIASNLVNPILLSLLSCLFTSLTLAWYSSLYTAFSLTDLVESTLALQHLLSSIFSHLYRLSRAYYAFSCILRLLQLFSHTVPLC